MHPSLLPFVGHRVRMVMSEGHPWFGVTLVGELAEPKGDKSPDGTLILKHKAGGDVILLPGAVSHVREAKASER